MERHDEELPKWFRMASKMAKHCSWGVVALFLLLKIPFVIEGINTTFLQWIYVFLILIAIPSFILCGPEILRILKALKNDDNK